MLFYFIQYLDWKISDHPNWDVRSQIHAASRSPVCLSVHASANQTQLTNRASRLNREGEAAGRWCGCALAASAHTDVCWGCLLTWARPPSLRGVNSPLFVCFYVMQSKSVFCFSLTGRINGAVVWTDCNSQSRVLPVKQHFDCLCTLKGSTHIQIFQSLLYLTNVCVFFTKLNCPDCLIHFEYILFLTFF